MNFINDNFMNSITNKSISKSYITFGMLTFDYFKNCNYKEICKKLEQICTINLVFLEVIYFDKNKLIFSFKNYNTDESYCILNNILNDLKKITQDKISISALNMKISELNNKNHLIGSNTHLNIFKILKMNMPTDNELIIVNKF